MIIDDEIIRVQYESTAESPIIVGDVLPVPYGFTEKEQLNAVLSNGTKLVYKQDYTVGDTSITLSVDIPIGDTITIYRSTPLDQCSEFPQEAKFNSKKIEDALDKLTMQNQEQREALSRALKLPLTASTDISDLSLPSPVPNKAVKWNSDGTALVNTDFDSDLALVITEQYKSQAQQAAVEAENQQNIATQQAGIATDKADAAATYATQAAETLAVAVTTITTEKEEAIEAVQNQQVNSINAVKAQQDTSIDAVKAQQNTSINAVKSQQNTSIDAVEAQQNTSINAVKSQQNTSIEALQEEGTTQVNLAKAEVTKATNQANNAKTSATNAQSSATNAQASATNAQSSATQAKTSATNAQSYATQAQTTLNNAKTEINTEKTNAVNAVKTQQSTSISAVQSQQNSSVNAVKTQQSTSISAVQSQQNSSVNAVKSTGQSYIDKCKAWASSDRIVEGGLYSAKHYAEMAQGKSDITYEHLRASRVYNDKGMLLSDEEGYADIVEMNRSTFGLSKFEVIGNPVITSDGVISANSSQDYVICNIPNLGELLHNANSWKIELEAIFSNGTSNFSAFFRQVSGASIVMGKIQTTFYFDLSSNGTSWDIADVGIDPAKLVDGTLYKYILEFTGTQYIGRIYKTDGTLVGGRIINSTLKVNPAQKYRIMSANPILDIPLDLKQFSITVDGKKVFNGNKSGLDIIKEDNFEVVGSPIITNDGILTHQSEVTNNYVYYNFGHEPTNFKVIFPVQFLETDTPSFGQGVARVFGWRVCYNYQEVRIFDGASQPLITVPSNNTLGNYIVQHIPVYFSIEKTGDTMTAGWSIDKINWTSLSSSLENATLPTTKLTEITLGSDLYWSFKTPVTIDLNLVKLYVDEQLVYQPCFKIPYNLSKNGAKIVPAYARDRVLDVYENHDKGYAYYTIDEENKNFTLPLGTTFDNSLRRNLENITENGNEKLATSLMYETGNVSNDEKGYKQLEKMNRSTFDLSKFAVIGTPSITDDGVASGFSSSVYVKTISTSQLSSNNFSIKLSFIKKENQQNLLLSSQYTAAQYGIALILNNNKIAFYLSSDGVDWDVSKGVVGKTIVNANVEYEVCIEYSANTYNVYLINKITGIKTTEVTIQSSSLLYKGTDIIKLGGGGWWSALDGSIDLKQFSITVNGKEVFNGNKTGLDVIKPDNYTIVGSPTISDDGILSNLSVGNYVNAPIYASDFKDKSWKIKGAIIANNETFGSFLDLFTSTNYNSGGLVNQNGGRLMFYARTGISSDASNQQSHFISSYSMQTGKKYYYELSFDIKTGTYNIILNNEDGSFFDAGSWTPTTDNKQLFAINVGDTVPLQFGKPVGNTCFKGSQDLNLFEVWIDGELVYQPCFKIPYNVSKTGSKIVPAYARARVLDLYEQEGHAGYYTIDEEKKNFTLPMGEIFGLIGQRSLRSVTRDGANYCEIYSDKTIEQGGTCTANVEVTFQQPFADRNYVLSVPYSSKTATSFIPTQTGDWIAKGKGV